MNFFRAAFLVFACQTVGVEFLVADEHSVSPVQQSQSNGAIEPFSDWVTDIFYTGGNSLPSRREPSVDGKKLSIHTFEQLAGITFDQVRTSVDQNRREERICFSSIQNFVSNYPVQLVDQYYSKSHKTSYNQKTLQDILAGTKRLWNGNIVYCQQASRGNRGLSKYFELSSRLPNIVESICLDSENTVREMRLREENERKRMAALDAEKKRLAEEERQRQVALKAEQEKLAKIEKEKIEAERRKQIAFEIEQERLNQDKYAEGKAAFDNGDYSRALELAQPLAEQGYADAENLMGIMYAKGLGLPQDIDLAKQWYDQAIEKGHMKAQNNLGLEYLTGEYLPQDFDEAMRLFQLAADQGFAPSQYFIGLMYASGEGVAKDDDESVKWFHEAAKNGFAPSQVVLGIAYQGGIGVPQDLEKAAYWFQMAVDQGNEEARIKLDELNNLLAVYAAEEARIAQAEAAQRERERISEAAQRERERVAEAERIAAQQKAQAEINEKKRRAEEREKLFQKVKDSILPILIFLASSMGFFLYGRKERWSTSASVVGGLFFGVGAYLVSAPFI